MVVHSEEGGKVGYELKKESMVGKENIMDIVAGLSIWDTFRRIGSLFVSIRVDGFILA